MLFYPSPEQCFTDEITKTIVHLRNQILYPCLRYIIFFRFINSHNISISRGQWIHLVHLFIIVLIKNWTLGIKYLQNKLGGTIVAVFSSKFSFIFVFFFWHENMEPLVLSKEQKHFFKIMYFIFTTFRSKVNSRKTGRWSLDDWNMCKDEIEQPTSRLLR